jgi:hypothetical protein
MKRATILFLFLILVFPVISAIDINMDSEIPKGETIIASFSGNFLDPIAKSNIYFYRGHVRTSFDYDVAKIGENYYIYVLTTGKAENNYSINISGIRYYVGSQVSSEQISKSFKILSETSDFSVNPGFVISHGNFSIKVQNLQSSPITINIETEVNSGSSSGFFGFLFSGQDVEQSITLASGAIKTLYINLENIPNTTIRTVKLSTANTVYDIPCYVIVENVPIPEENTTISNQTDTTNNQTNTTTNNQTNTTINNGTNTTTNGNCTFFGYLFGTCNSTIVQNQTNIPTTNQTNQTKNNSADYEVIKVGNETVAIKNGTILNGSATSKTCAQIKGDICSSGEICKNTTIYAKDAKCCISSCVKEEVSSNNKIIGWVLVGVIAIIILRFFVKKFSKTKRKDDPLLNHKR